MRLSNAPSGVDQKPYVCEQAAQPELTQEIFQIVDSVQPEARYKTLVIDRVVEKIFSYCVEKDELLQRKVANILILDNPRPTESYLEAIYITSFNKYCCDCIHTDCIRIPRRYAGAHVFFLPGYTLHQLERFIEGNPWNGYLLSCEPAPIDYLALERQIFTLGDPFANDRLYNIECAKSRDLVHYLDKIARQIADVCIGLEEFQPYIRYYTPHDEYPQKELPKVIAELVHTHLDRVKNQYLTPELEKKGRGTVVIMDRNIDPYSTLLHEFTYQAMAYDLLKFKDGNTYVAADGTTAQLDEKDADWVELRHKHISEVADILTQRVRELKEVNPHFADSSKEVTVSDVRNMLASLPAFVKARDSVATNLQVAFACIDAVDKEDLKTLAEIEQQAALGSNTDGVKNPEQLADDLVAILANKDVPKKNKVRLLLIYVLSRKYGLFRKDFERLKLHSGLDDRDLETVTNYQHLGFNLIKTAEDQEHNIKKKHKPILWSETQGEQFLFERYVPSIKNIAKQMVEHQLDTKFFPFFGEEPEPEDLQSGTATSLRNPRQRATWARARVTQQSKPKQILFILGGITASEARSVYEINEREHKDVILGGNDMITPNKFLMFLSRITLPRDQLGLPSDAQSRSVPKFLMASDREIKQQLSMQAAHSDATGGGPRTAAPPPASGAGVGAGLTNSEEPLMFGEARAKDLEIHKPSKDKAGVRGMLKTSMGGALFRKKDKKKK